MRSRSSLCPRALPPGRRPPPCLAAALRPLPTASGAAGTFYAAAVAAADPPSADGAAVVDSVCPLFDPLPAATTLADQRTDRTTMAVLLRLMDATVCCQWPPVEIAIGRVADDVVDDGGGGGGGSCYLCSVPFLVVH